MFIRLLKVIFLFFSIVIMAQKTNTLSKVMETIVIDDNLDGSTSGTKVGGSFNSDGYSPGTGKNHILYEVPSQIPNGYAEFEIKGFSNSSMPADENHAFICLYDGRGISEPIGYYDDFKHNYFRWNVHWRENRNAFKGVIACADPTSERINSNSAVYEDQNGDGLDSHDRDWYDEPTGSGQSWNTNSWYTVRVQWNNKNFKIIVDGVTKWSVSGPNDYNPVDFKIWLGSGPDKYDSDVNVTYRNFKLVSYGATTSNYLTINPNSENIDFNSGSFDFNISSIVNWNINEDVDWLSVSASSGNGNETITVNYDENISTIQRSGDIVVSGGGITRTLSVTQSENVTSNYLFLPVEVDSVSAEEETYAFSINSNVDWTITYDSTWATIDKMSGNGNEDITVNFSKNESLEDRSVELLVENIAGDEIFELIQKGKIIPGYLSVDDFPDTVDHNSGSFSFTLNSNLEWTIADSVTWLSKSPNSGSGDTTVTVNYTENLSHEVRKTHLIIMADTIQFEKSVTQLGIPFVLNISTNSSEGGTVEGEGSYHLGTTVTCIATPSSGWRFSNISEADSIVSLDSIYTFEVNRDRNLLVNFELLTNYDETLSLLPDKFSLENNFPNPFNPTTQIGFSLPEAAYVSIKLYDMLGNFVTNILEERKARGKYVQNFNAEGFASGIYYYQMKAGEFMETKRLILLK